MIAVKARGEAIRGERSAPIRWIASSLRFRNDGDGSTLSHHALKAIFALPKVGCGGQSTRRQAVSFSARRY